MSDYQQKFDEILNELEANIQFLHKQINQIDKEIEIKVHKREMNLSLIEKNQYHIERLWELRHIHDETEGLNN